MELEQLEKRLEWLDEERRKDKALAAALDSRIAQLESRLASSRKETTSFQAGLAQIKLIFGKLELMESKVDQVKMDLAMLNDSMDKVKADVQSEVEKKIAGEMDVTGRAIQDLRKGFHSLQEMKKVQKELDTDVSLIKTRLQKLDEKMAESQDSFDQYKQSQKLYDESRKAENKRLTDMQGEVSAYRKRMDELRARIDLTLENLRNLDTRIVEITTAESGRKQTQVAFIDKFNQQQVERDRIWRDWQQKMDSVIQNGSNVELQFKNFEETLRNVRRTREQLDEAAQKMDRRVNEITEMHRLNEDHFRQEWNGFKADDQKRWANYSLIMDEQQKDYDRAGERMEKRLVALEDQTQAQGDRLANIQNEEEKKLQQLVAMAHDWLSTYERLLGKSSDLI
ncbi:MAG: hypothetical protein C0391_03100 [Anaerolinea sp.]|nr:hypothetical protein [Anaerolinea sp.]